MSNLRRHGAPLLVVVLMLSVSQHLTFRQFVRSCGEAGIQSVQMGLLGLGSRVVCHPPAPASTPGSIRAEPSR